MHFQCGKVDHRDEHYPTYFPGENQCAVTQDRIAQNDPTKAVAMTRPGYTEEFGPWMLVKMPARKKNSKSNVTGTKEKNPTHQDPVAPVLHKTPPK